MCIPQREKSFCNRKASRFIFAALNCSRCQRNNRQPLAASRSLYCAANAKAASGIRRIVMTDSTTRRQFLQTSATAVLASPLLAHGVHADGNDLLKVGLIGCGGRGT